MNTSRSDAIARLKRNPIPTDYVGMNYKQCSILGQLLCLVAAQDGNWFNLPAHLEMLKMQMRIAA